MEFDIYKVLGMSGTHGESESVTGAGTLGELEPVEMGLSGGEMRQALLDRYREQVRVKERSGEISQADAEGLVALFDERIYEAEDEVFDGREFDFGFERVWVKWVED
jgi:hypothetical protein